MLIEHVILPESEGKGPIAVIEKRLSSRERAEPEAAARLRGEAALLAALGGIFTPRLVATGADERGPWLQTEKLAFPTLATRIAEARGVSLDPAWLARAVRASFEALAHLHDASDAAGPLRIVHADISPANLAIDDAGAHAVFLDLELACWRDGSSRDGAFRGTVAYAAPEVARGEAPSAAADVFSLAATLLHAVLGAPPRDGPSLAAVLGFAAERPLLDEPYVVRAELSRRGGPYAALARCLAHEPADRPSSCREVLALLR